MNALDKLRKRASKRGRIERTKIRKRKKRKESYEELERKLLEQYVKILFV
jgi:hypothetical protein